MILFIGIKRGVYRHDIVSANLELETTAKESIAWLQTEEPDHYHTIEIIEFDTTSRQECSICTLEHTGKIIFAEYDVLPDASSRAIVQSLLEDQ